MFYFYRELDEAKSVLLSITEQEQVVVCKLVLLHVTQTLSYPLLGDKVSKIFGFNHFTESYNYTKLINF